MPRNPFRVVRWPGSPYWYAVFALSGKRCVRSTEVPRRLDTRAEALRKAAEIWLQETARAGAFRPGEAAGFTLKELADSFQTTDLAVLAQRRGPKYRSALEGHLANHVLTRFSRAEEVTTQGWEAAKQAMHDDGLTWGAIQRVTSSARALLRFCCRVGALASEPVLHAPSNEDARRDAAPRRALSEAERDAFLGEVAKIDPRAHRIYVVMFWSGLRENEVEKLRLRWINWRTGFVFLPAPDTKSKKLGQDLYLHPLVQEAIKAELAARGDISPDEPIFGPFDLRLVFDRAVAQTTVDGKPLDVTGLTAHHTARHTCATLVGERAETVAEIRAVTRHQSLSMLERYWHPNGKLSKGALGRL